MSLTITSLPPEMLTRIVSFLNGADQDQTLLANKSFGAPVHDARRAWIEEQAQRPGRFTAEKFPTRLELQRFGITTPNMAGVLFAAAPLHSAPAVLPSLRANAQAQARLQKLLRARELRTLLPGETLTTHLGEHESGVQRFIMLRSADRVITYEGGLVSDRKCGFGYQRKGTFQSEGLFQDNQLHGEGTTLGTHGYRYDGGFQGGKFHGQGVWLRDNGWRYEGNFKSNKRHGTGKQTYEDGTRHEGNFRDGYLQGDGTATFKGGVVYTGPFLYGQPHGAGVLTRADGLRFEASFNAGELHGPGRWFGADGRALDARSTRDDSRPAALVLNDVRRMLVDFQEDRSSDDLRSL